MSIFESARHDYLPYGMLHNNGSLATTDNNDYRYNGKEYQERFGVDLYDSFARQQGTDGRFRSGDPLAGNFPWMSPYAYCAGNPVNFIDPDGLMADGYYNSLNGKYLGDDGAVSEDIRLIDSELFQRISTQHNGTTNATATSALQSASKIITIDEGQIQSTLQSVADNSRSSKLEHSAVIVLDRETATISAANGPTGTNDQVVIEYYPGSATGASFHEKPGGPIIIGQAHGHPTTSKDGHITQATMSGNDTNVATSMQIPIYGIDAMKGRTGTPANIHRANPDGSISNKVGTTQTIQMGRQAMEIWGKSKKPLY